MNQILEPVFLLTDDLNNSSIKEKRLSYTKLYKIQFIIFSAIACILLIFLFIRLFKQNEHEILSQKLLSSYTISTLYSNENNYNTTLTSNDFSSHPSTPFVIGLLKIDKINLNYPILSETTDELLDISICRFAGPMPNKEGNLCIAGHNYVDYKLFSRLNELEINDTFEVYDLNGEMIKYCIFNKYETDVNNISCTTQNTNGNKIVTLLTCNNVNGKRLIVVGKET